jgi:hypothetical protein
MKDAATGHAGCDGRVAFFALSVKTGVYSCTKVR